MRPPTLAEIVHDIQIWSEDEVTIKEESRSLQSSKTHQPQKNLCPKTQMRKLSDFSLLKKKISIRKKGVQNQVDPIITKKIELKAKKTIKMETKVKNPKVFEQK